MNKYVVFALLGALCLIAGSAFAQSEATQRLLERNEMFEPDIIQIADNVYTAIGYQVSTNTMIIGDDGVIIVDPGQMVPASRQVRALGRLPGLTAVSRDGQPRSSRGGPGRQRSPPPTRAG